MKESAILKLKEGCSAMGLWSTTVAAWQQGRQHRQGRQLQHKTWRWSTSSTTTMVLAASGWWVGGRWLWVRRLVAMRWFFFFGFVGVGFVIKGGHRWWSPAWEASLVSLLAWGWKTHVGLRGIHELPGLGWAYSRSHGANTWKVVSYLAGLLFWWFCFLLVVYSCVVWTGSLFLYQNWRKTTTLPIE